MSISTLITERCEICREEAKAGVDFDSSVRLVECPRCGRYRITPGARALLEHDKLTDLERARLSAVTRRATERKGFTDIVQDLLPVLINSVSAPTDPMEAADDVLLYLSTHARSFGAQVPFDIATLYPLFVLLNQEALNNVVQYMLSQRWIALSTGTIAALIILPNGYTRLRELRQTRKGSSKGFVAMSFDPQLRPTYDEAIKPAIVSAGFEPIRMDDTPHNDRIDERIIVEIRRSAFLVADFSDPRSGVFFEAGYALGYGLPVIWTCSAAKFDEVPKHFDTRQFNHIRWESIDDLRLQLKTRLLATIPGAQDSSTR